MAHQRICVRHPDYHAQNVLLSLPARDGASRDRAHFPTVIAACSIITDNNPNVSLSPSPDCRALPRLDPDAADDTIPAGDYFLHVPPPEGPAPPSPYPIIPNFRAWSFPHHSLPPLWVGHAPPPKSNVNAVAQENCRITNLHLACEDAQIIPASEKSWFTSNEMDQYGLLSARSGDAIADTWVNKVRLQAHARRLWDELHFGIVSRRVQSATGHPGSTQSVWFTQMLSEHDELEVQWHQSSCNH
ncbi:hypothetical protein EJ03DRAFT_352112 [Teratosphaeria nubilosa]|uniref:HNH nuclease domain-containing protein n=1 Tax=Teratosphaeria nubilosa TaxID=161662 RepID=A0A6G1L829_9PEZI|nr:hypothetical protein EJ03DRAFT_352112 [Teratosphaeria nubilosa]